MGVALKTKNGFLVLGIGLVVEDSFPFLISHLGVAQHSFALRRLCLLPFSQVPFSLEGDIQVSSESNKGGEAFLANILGKVFIFLLSRNHCFPRFKKKKKKKTLLPSLLGGLDWWLPGVQIPKLVVGNNRMLN